MDTISLCWVNENIDPVVLSERDLVLIAGGLGVVAYLSHTSVTALSAPRPMSQFHGLTVSVPPFVAATSP